MMEIHTPHDVEYEINNENFKIGKSNYPIKSIKYFDIKKSEEITKILVYTSDQFMPIKFIQIPDELSEEIEKELAKREAAAPLCCARSKSGSYRFGPRKPESFGRDQESWGALEGSSPVPDWNALLAPYFWAGYLGGGGSAQPAFPDWGGGARGAVLVR